MEGDYDVAILRRTFLTIEKLGLYLSMIFTFAMMVIITFDAMGRYIFNSPITGAYELVEKFIMPAVVFLALNYSYKDNQQISIEVLYDKSKGIIRLLLDVIKLLVMILIMAIITYQGMHLTIEAFIDKRMDFGSLPIHLYWAYIWIPIGAGIMTIRLIVDLVKKFTNYNKK